MIRPGALWEQRRHRLAVQKIQERCQKQEDALLKPRTPSALEQKLAPAAQKLQDAAPQKVRQGLEAAFEKSFLALLARPELVGRGLRPAASGDENASLRQQRFAFYQARRRSGAGALGYTLFSGGEAAALGVLGIGLPDIPILLGTLLRSLYGVCAQYGHDWQSPQEQAFLLAVLAAAAAPSEEARPLLERCRLLGQAIDAGQDWSAILDVEQAAGEASRQLCRTVVAAKLVQGVPLAGVCGGWYNGKLLSRATKLASCQYQRRWAGRFSSAD